MSEDTRTMADLAREALQVQDACNLSGVVHSFSRAITRLRVLLEAEGNGGTSAVNTHPVCMLFTDKLADLARIRDYTAFEAAYAECARLSGTVA